MFNLFGKKTGPTMDTVMDDIKEDAAIRLFDVRTEAEFDAGHLPGSINLPLDSLDSIDDLVPDKDTKVYLYCRSGSRSGYAASHLKRMGYSQAFNAGGIISYRGPVER